VAPKYVQLARSMTGRVSGALAVAALAGALLTPLWMPASLEVARAERLGADQSAAPQSFAESFNARPAQPERWHPADWDVTVNNAYYPNSLLYGMESPMRAGHGPDCAAPGERNEVTHGPVRLWEDAVYACRDHVMTALGTGYGAIWLTPPAQLDLSQDEAVMRIDLSTFRSSTRDWVEFLVVPWDDDFQTVNDANDLFPRNGVRVEMVGIPGDTHFNIHLYRNGVTETIQGGNVRLEKVLTPSAVRRDTFELRLSRTHVKFGMPAYNLWWQDQAIAPLSFDRGVVHLGHYSYTPEKDYPQNCPENRCTANTWHWDNLSLSSSAPFSIARPAERFAEGGQDGNGKPEGPDELTFAQPAPDGAYLRMAARGAGLRLSFDGGASWTPVQYRPQTPQSDSRFGSTWTPVPAGATRVLVQADPTAGHWFVHSVSLWSPQRP
jgi:hypothetical protein